jgi:hypothetical protein
VVSHFCLTKAGKPHFEDSFLLSVFPLAESRGPQLHVMVAGCMAVALIKFTVE